MATMVSMYAQKRGWDIGEVSVDVDYDAKSSPRGVIAVLHLPSDLSPERVRRLEHVARTCPLRRALEAGFSFEERLVTVPGSAPASLPSSSS
jgi:uncharacterized OsmC-like protein